VRGFTKFRLEHLQYAVDIGEHIIVPDPDCAIAERAQRGIALPICGAIRMLPAVNLNDETPIAAEEVDVIGSNRLLADEFEAGKLAVT